jgi:ABC-type Fe3+-hydroxamate transport system substrate-binding protein
MRTWYAQNGGGRSVSLAFLAALTAAVASSAWPQRIISASPHITEILYGVGAFDRVIAVSDYCTYPPAVKTLPRIGKWQSSNLEAIAALRADLVMLSDAQAPFMEAELRELGVRFLVVPSRTLRDVFAAIDLIGRATGHEAQARDLAAAVQARLDAVRLRTSLLPRRRVLLIVDRSPGTLRDLYAATQGSFLAELVAIAGGACVAAPARAGYGKISKEAVVALDPDVIIDFVHGSRTRLGEDPLAVWADLPELRAVREGHVYPARDEFLPHASQFVADTAELFARWIHPEAQNGKGSR